MNGLPGIGTERLAEPRKIFASFAGLILLPSNKVIDGSKSRDALNTGDLDVLRAGIVMGKITSGGKYAPAILGVSTVAYDGGTSLTVSAATAVEIVRRIGATGTLVLVGPASAGGTVRSQTLTFSAVNTTTGVVTVTATDVSTNEVQTVGITGTLSAGTFTLRFVKSDGTVVVTDPIAYNADTAGIQAGVDSALGASKCVVGGTAITAFTLTFSGTGYAGLAQTLVEVDTSGLTGEAATTVTRTTAGGTTVGDAIAGSFIGVGDGSETPVTLITEEYGVKVTDDDGVSIDVPFVKIPLLAQIDASQIINYPTDASLKAWLKAALRANVIGMTFDDDF